MDVSDTVWHGFDRRGATGEVTFGREDMARTLKPNKPKSKRRLEKDAPPGSKFPLNPPTPLKPGRKWLFRLLALFLIPLLFLGGLEAALRLAGYGSSFHLFKTIRIGDRDFVVNDDLFGQKFFPPEMTRSPSAFRMEPQKPAGAYRIFILGESAAMGDPEPAFGAGRYLEVMLRERFPGQKFEVINLGITAINSHVIVPIARECARREGDLWIVYMGNNEMVGPFGAATVFGSQAPPVAVVRLSLAIRAMRIGQLLGAVGRKLRKPEARAWGGMQMFVENELAPDDRRREIVYANFQRNLKDIVRAGLDSGAGLLLSTVAVNLRDCPPFASLDATNLSAADAGNFQQAFAAAASAESQGNFAGATLLLAQAAAISRHSAELEFRLGQCELQVAKNIEARRHLQSACDLDALPFRADSRINGIILQLEQQFRNPKLRVFDAAAALGSLNPSGISGGESFYEHVHLNFDGNYALALAWAGQVGSMLPSSITNGATAAGWPSQKLCERRLGLTDWNRGAVVESVIHRLYEPPLGTQPNNARRIEALRYWVNELNRRKRATDPATARAIYLEAIQRAPDDYYLHENFAAFLGSQGEKEQATTEWRHAHDLIPQDFVVDYRLGQALAEQGKFTEAEPILTQALTSHPGFTEGWMKLAEVHAAQSKLEAALAEYEHARQLQPNDPLVPYELGRVLSRLHRSAESIRNFREAIRLRPDYWEAHYTLGGELGMHDQIQEAQAEFMQVIRLQPDYPGGHLNLGVAMLKQKLLDDAERQFLETLQLDPGDKVAPAYLKQARAMKNQRP
ncbi:MAG: hypothetical protein JWQ04_565 [Pedosphaera sp.]|nr:hypothetical protein [Pedosphaera sp.]